MDEHGWNRFRIEDGEPDDTQRREMPGEDDDAEVERRQFPRPGRDIRMPFLPDGHTDVPMAP